MAFHAYILLCSDGSYYTGHTDDLQRRIAAHHAAQVKGYTQTRRPLRLVWSQEFPTRHEALAAERQIKGWSRAKKEAMIDGRWDEVSRLAKSSRGIRPSTGSGRTGVSVNSATLTQILAHAAETAPDECCGILLGKGSRITAALPAANVHPAPRTRFEIDPQALVDAHRASRAGGPAVLGYYHSHPQGPARPSATDAALANRDGSVWVIVAGTSDVTFWQDGEEGFIPLPYGVVHG